jgi:hypothetical protein
MRDWIILSIAVIAWLALGAFIGNWIFTRVPLRVAISPKTTAVIVAVTLPALGMIDYLFALIGGNSSTMSAVLMAIRANYVVVAFATAYALGMFLTHCYMPSPSTTRPSEIELIAWAIVAFSPIFSSLFIIFSNDGGDAQGIEAITRPDVQIKLTGILLGGLIGGGLVGRFILCQRPLAGG